MQKLHLSDGNGLNFFEWGSTKIYWEINFFDYVLFIDESTFHNNGKENRHNFDYLTINPHFIGTNGQT